MTCWDCDATNFKTLHQSAFADPFKNNFWAFGESHLSKEDVKHGLEPQNQCSCGSNPSRTCAFQNSNTFLLLHCFARQNIKAGHFSLRWRTSWGRHHFATRERLAYPRFSAFLWQSSYDQAGWNSRRPHRPFKSGISCSSRYQRNQTLYAEPCICSLGLYEPCDCLAKYIYIHS